MEICSQPGKDDRVAHLLVLSSADTPALPALELLGHVARTLPASTVTLANAPQADAYVIDARADLVAAKSLCRILRTSGATVPILAVMTEGGLPAVSAEWGVDDVIVSAAGPAEIDARVRLLLARAASALDDAPATRVATSGITIDEASYAARANGRTLDLTYKEFQLLHFLAAHPSRVFTREQLLSEVWGYDYFGGTRTVDVHVRRLRAKLGDLESLIGTVRNVGYRFDAADDDSLPDDTP